MISALAVDAVGYPFGVEVDGKICRHCLLPRQEDAAIDWLKLRMSDMPTWSEVKERAAGKWQLPLLALSLGLLFAAVLRIQPGTEKLSEKDALAYLDKLVSNRLFDEAAATGDALLDRARDEGFKTGPIHLRLARTRFGQAVQAEAETSALGRRVTDEYQAAMEQGESTDADDLARLGQSFDWQGENSLAISYLEQAVTAGVTQASDFRKRIIELSEQSLTYPPNDQLAKLEEMLANLEPARLDLRIWALERQLHVLADLGRLDDAATLLVRNEPAFSDSDFENHFRFLQGLLLFKQGEPERAETFLRTIRNDLTPSDEVHAMTGWLLGRVILADESGPERPLEALSFFSDVLHSHPGSIFASASRLESARAFAYLERHEEAIGAYRVSIGDLARLHGRRLVNPDVVRTSLGVTAEVERQAGHLEPALGYITLASTVIDRENVEQSTLILRQLAQIQAQLAEKLEAEAIASQEDAGLEAEALAQRAREMFSAAAMTQRELAKLNIGNERRSAQANWLAAELYARAGQVEQGAQLFEEYARERPGDSLVPRALYRVGKLYQSAGRWEEAIEAFQRCYRRFPRTLDGARALVPLAECHLAQGPGQEELAEKTLNIVLEESKVFTPQAPDFADAIFLMGDVLNRRNAPERAIAVLEEGLSRYPDDPRVTRTRFLLADSYRKSALALLDELSDASYEGELAQMRAEATSRFTKARQLYRQLIDEYELDDPTRLGPLARVYYNLAVLYEADCFFDTLGYRQALKLYEEAVAALKDDPRGLSAYVQIINCHVFLGQPAEARAALARAMIEIDGLPPEAFAVGVSPETRDDWRQYFTWLGNSELF